MFEFQTKGNSRNSQTAARAQTNSNIIRLRYLLNTITLINALSERNRNCIFFSAISPPRTFYTQSARRLTSLWFVKSCEIWEKITNTSKIIVKNLLVICLWKKYKLIYRVPLISLRLYNHFRGRQ